MKKKLLLVLSIMTIIMLAAACGSPSQTPKAPESDSKETETETESKESETIAETETDTKAETEADTEADTTPEDDGTDSAKAVSLKVYHSDSEAMGFETTQMDIDDLNAENVLAAVLFQINFPETIKPNNFSQDGNALTLDLPQEFMDHLRANSGSSAEYLYIGSIVNTFLDAFDAETLQITIDGNVMETGHSDYPTPLQRYE